MSDIILTRGRPSPRQRRAMVLAMTRNRLAYEKWLSRRIVELDRKLKRELLEDPSESNRFRLKAQYRESLLDVFVRLYYNVGNRMADMLADDEKSVPGMETKKKKTEKEKMDERTRLFIEEQVGYRITRICDSTFAKVQSWYYQAEGDVGKFEDLLQSHFSEARSRRIAVTETTMAMNRTLNDTAKELSFGRPMEKEWMSSHMSNMRKGHEDADGQTVDMDEPFLVESPRGQIEKLMYPTDSSLGATACNCVNCRCVSIPRYKS